MSLLPGARRPPPVSGPRPGGYQSGFGRGAVPFTTRADLGAGGRGAGGRGHGSNPSASDAWGPAPTGYIPGRGRGATGFAGGVSRDDATTSIEDRDRGDYSESNYDEFTGYSEGLFNTGEYDEEDRQADIVYDQIDQRMDTRRKAKREQRFKEELSKLRAEKPTLSQQFSHLKRGLNQVSQEEWESIPEIGDYSLRGKQKKPRTSSVTPAPDSLLLAAHTMSQPTGSFDTRGIGGGAVTKIGFGLQTPLAGFQTPLGLRTPLGLSGLTTPMMMGGLINDTSTPLMMGGGFRTPMNGGNGSTPSLNDLGEARGTVLTVKLDKVMDSITGQSVIDPKGYLTDLNSLPISTDANIQDIKKARLLLRSVTQTNPQHAPGWIAAARLEELSGKPDAARELIAQGCALCQHSEDVWLEAARLEKPSEAKSILANGVHVNPTSVKLWLEAARREEEISNKRQVLRKALENIPNSVRLWKEAISLEGRKDAEILLGRAVECIPTSVDMWLALAKLSKYENAQRVLNEARKYVPTSIDIWITAAKLEESHSKMEMVDRIIARAVENLTQRGAGRDRDAWVRHAEDVEKTKYYKTCEAIIKATMDIGVEPVNRKKIWVTDAEGALERGMTVTTRCLYTSALRVLPKDEDLWIALAQLEMVYGTAEALDEILTKSVERDACPHSETLWLMAAKQKWIRGEVETARKLLEFGFQAVVNKESIYLAAVKLERESGETERARKLLAAARIGCRNSEKVWIHSVQLERMLHDYHRAYELVEEGRKLHPKCAKLWMIAGQLMLERADRPEEEAKIEALRMFEKGRKEIPRSVPLWLCAVEIHREAKNWNRARALLEEARLKNPKNELLWLSAVEVEIEAAGVSRIEWVSQANVVVSNLQMAHHMMSKALQECPKSGLLWADAIFLEPKAAQNAKSVDAFTACENDPHVMLAAAKLFWKSNRAEKARRWCNLAIKLNPKLGDAWAAYFAFELIDGNDRKRKIVLQRCLNAEPNCGLQWNRVVKRHYNWRLTYPEKLRVVVEEYYPHCWVPAAQKTPVGQEVTDILHGRVELPSKDSIKQEQLLKEQREAKEKQITSRTEETVLNSETTTHDEDHKDVSPIPTVIDAAAERAD